MNHNYKLQELQDFREMKKGKPFDPKTMPMVDFKRIEVCEDCGIRMITTGFEGTNGEFLPFGLAGYFEPCVPANKEDNLAFSARIDSVCRERIND